MNIENLRLKHKTMIVDHALRWYGGADIKASVRRRGIDFLLSGGDLCALIEALKNDSPVPNAIIQPTAVTEAIGAVVLNVSNLVFHVGETRFLQVTVENCSDLTWQTSEETPIYLSYHWYYDSGGLCIFDGLRTPLASPIPPGEKRVMEITVPSPNEPGRYQIELTMIYEAQYWLEDRGLSVRRLPVMVEALGTSDSIGFDENHCVDLGRWEAWVDRVTHAVIRNPLPDKCVRPAGATLWFCVMGGINDDLPTGFLNTQASLMALSLGVQMPVEVLWTRHLTEITGRHLEKLADLDSLIGPTDLVVFVQFGDEIHPDTPTILVHSGAFGSRFLVFDFWFREGDLARPVLLHGADAVHGQICDYFQSRFAVRGDTISKAARAGALGSLRTLALWALTDSVTAQTQGLQHVPFPLLRAARLSNAQIASQQRDLIHAMTHPQTPIVASHQASVSAVICTKDNCHQLRVLVRKLLAHDLISDVVIVSNNTSDVHALVLLEELSRNQRCTVLRYDQPFNFSAQCNLGVKYSRGKYLLFLNDDVLPVSDDWLAILLQQVDNNPRCISGPLLLYPDQTVQHSGMYLGYHGCAGHAFRGARVPAGAPMFELIAPRQVSCLTGAALLMARELYADLNGFDQMMATMLQDVDLCLRALFSGAKLVFDPRAILFHMESVSIKTTLVGTVVQRRREAEYAYFAKRWHSVLNSDPWINPNLNVQDETWRSLHH